MGLMISSVVRVISRARVSSRARVCSNNNSMLLYIKYYI